MAFVDVAGEILVDELLEIEQRNAFRLHHRQLRDISDPFQLPTSNFKKIFRFNKETVLIIINMIEPFLRERQRQTAIPNHIKILATLQFYASGSYQLSSGHGYYFALSQPSVSRCLTEVTDVIYHHLLANWIVFPNTRDKRNSITRGFLEKFNFPRCLGAIDCTHVAIISPPENYPALPYYCRKGYYSINCQIIVDSNLNILNMNARFPGSTHDAAIWQASTIRTVMTNLYIQGDNSVLIGDSGYPLQPFLVTPFENPVPNTAKERYNHNFTRARTTIERLNGVLKSRFRCLSKHRVLNYDPVKSGKIIYCCGVLHNIAQFHNDVVEEEQEEQDDPNQNYDVREANVNQNWFIRGQAVSNTIVQHFH